MPAYYTFLVSSLPMLNFNAKPPLNLENFFAQCKNLIPDKELEILIRSCQQDASSVDPQARVSLKRWADFETTLRNELVRARAARKKIDPLKFLRLPDEPQTQISHLAAAAYRSSSILEAEQTLDQARWNFLEDLSFGHYFDFDYLLIYGLKLKILERWDKIQKSDKEYLFNSVVAN